MTSLAGKKVALLVANGFDENQMSEIQRALTRTQAETRTISPEQGVVNGWQGDGWGHYFPVNTSIGEALGSDFDMLVLPGGSRGVERLKANPHTRRIVKHFIEAEKPVAAIGEGVGLLTLAGSLQDRILAASDDVRDELETAGAGIVDETQVLSGNLLTADGSDLAAWVEAVMEFFAAVDAMKEAA